MENYQLKNTLQIFNLQGVFLRVELIFDRYFDDAIVSANCINNIHIFRFTEDSMNAV